jgi:hypothetical protein
MSVIYRSSDIGELAKHPDLAPTSWHRNCLGGNRVSRHANCHSSGHCWRPRCGPATKGTGWGIAGQEFAYATAILDTDDTGIENTLWFTPVPGGVDGPRIKVAIDPAKAIRDSGLTGTVPFDASAVEQISPALEKQVRAFIELNRDVLMRYWRLDPSITSTKKFAELLRPIPIGE